MNALNVEQDLFICEYYFLYVSMANGFTCKLKSLQRNQCGINLVTDIPSYVIVFIPEDCVVFNSAAVAVLMLFNDSVQCSSTATLLLFGHVSTGSYSLPL